MGLREVLAELDVRVRGAGAVTAAHLALDRYSAAVPRTGARIESLRVHQQQAAEMATQFAGRLRILQQSEGASATQVEALRRAQIRAAGSAAQYGRAIQQLTANQRAYQGSTGGFGGGNFMIPPTASASIASVRAGITELTPAIAGMAIAGVVAHRAITFLVGQLQEVITTGAELAHTAPQVGLSVRELQEWRFISGRSGIQAEAVTAAFGRLARSAQAGSPAFHRLGVATRDANHQLRSQGDIAADTLIALRGIPSATERSAIAQQVFGRAGAEMLTIVADQNTSLEELRQRFADLGGGLDPGVATAAAEADDALGDFHVAMEGLRGALVVGVLPALARGVATLAGWIGSLTNATRHSSAMEAGWVMLRTAGQILMPVIGGIAGAAALLIAPFALAFLAIEDVITAFRGGRSVTSRFVEGLMQAMGVTISFQGSIEAWGVTWDMVVSRIQTGVADLLAQFEALQRFSGITIPGLSGAATDARARAAAARATAVEGVTSFGRREDARRRARAGNGGAPGDAPETAVVESRGSRRGGRGSHSTTVHAPLTVQVQGPDPDAVVRAIGDHHQRRIREAADSLPLGAPA